MGLKGFSGRIIELADNSHQVLMIDCRKTHSLTEFVRNSKAFADRIEQEHEPIGLTVNGKVKLVVLDADSFEAMSSAVERQRFVEAIREGEQAIRDGRVLSADEVYEGLKLRYGL